MTTLPKTPPSAGMIAPIYARQLRMLLQQTALDGDRALAAAELDWASLLTDDRALPRDTVIRLITAALSITRQPWLGLELAASVPITSHGPLGPATVTARDLAACLAVLVKYGALRNDAFAWSMHTSAQGGVVRGVDSVDWGEARGFMLDMVAGTVLQLIKAALGLWPRGLVVDLPLPSPRWAAQYGRFAPVVVRFGQPVLAFHVDAGLLGQPCLGADAHAHAMALKECERALAELSGRSLTDRVAGLLSDAPPGHCPRLEDIAAACHLTPRTLMRHLGNERTTFGALLDSTRKTRALWLIQNTQHSVEEIAAQLGYLDTSNFSRTVRRWFGETPRELRRRQAQARDQAGTP